jgi:hypothetical protein
MKTGRRAPLLLWFFVVVSLVPAGLAPSSIVYHAQTKTIT